MTATGSCVVAGTGVCVDPGVVVAVAAVDEEPDSDPGPAVVVGATDVSAFDSDPAAIAVAGGMFELDSTAAAGFSVAGSGVAAVEGCSTAVD